MTGCRKYPLPTPFFPCIGVFALKSIGQSDSAQATLNIGLVLSLYQIEVLQTIDERNASIYNRLRRKNDNDVIFEESSNPMSNLNGRICVFTGSRYGVRAEFADAAKLLGRELIERHPS